MSIYNDLNIRSVINEVLQGYYIKLNSRNDWTLEDIKKMLEDDLKTLREWDGEDMINQILTNDK